jgi:hypothetical protein
MMVHANTRVQTETREDNHDACSKGKCNPLKEIGNRTPR